MVFEKCFSINLNLLFLLLGSVCVGICDDAKIQQGKKEEGSDSTEKTIPVKYDEQHRGVQWCVNGVDEPEFQLYPFNEFQPILRRKYYEPYVANLRYRYTVDLRPIKIKASQMAAIGNGGHLYQRAHFVFKSEIRREFVHDVKTQYNETKIEGLLVQVNYAPLGVGLPTGLFLHPNEFNCVDCQKPVGVPIACRRRTYFHSVHPTLLAYHHKMRVPITEVDRRKNYCINQLLPSQCIIEDFEDYRPATAAGTQDLKKWDWKEKLGAHLHQPHPDITSTCSETKECKDQFKHWFRNRCCYTDANGLCDGAPPPPGPGGGGGPGPGPGGPPPPPPPGARAARRAARQAEVTTPRPEKSNSCPNKNAPATDTVYSDPYRQSKVIPKFVCRPFEVTVCRPPEHAGVLGWETQADLDTDYSKPPSPPSPPTNGSGGGSSTPKFNRFSTDEQCCLGVTPGEECPTTPTNETQAPKGKKTCPKEDASQGIRKTLCMPRIVLPYNQETNQEAPEPDSSTCDTVVSDNFGATSEVHGNLVWYFPPCYYTSRVRFQFIVVHSFSRGIYSVVESDDYYDLRSGAQGGNQGKLNPSIPSPLFTGFPHTCEALSNSAHFLYSKSFPDAKFDYSRSYDECIQKTGEPIQRQSCRGIPTFKPYVPPQRPGENKAFATIESEFPKCDPNQDAEKPEPCESECPKLPQTTLLPVTTEGESVIKRTLHGCINIVTNFCIMPICVFIARFYKETYNLESYKSHKKWYWMHMIGAGGSTVLMYLGYFTRKLVNVSDDHVTYGNFYIVCLGLSYLTAWIRHKKRMISMIVEIVHIGCGYGCFILALVCVTNAKHNGEYISDACRHVVYAAIGSLAVFYVGMTIHICSLDSRFGMKPRRWHFPTVESRFDDLPVPGRNVRKFFLIAVLCINLPLTLATIFL